MTNIKWIKINTDIFNDEKISMIEGLPESDTIIVIWFKLLCLAGCKNDSGLIYFTRDIPYTDISLSRVLNRDIEIVRLALKTFIDFKMIEIEDDIISILNWDKHQNKNGLEKIRDQNRIRQERYRKNQKKLINNIKEIDIEKDIDIEGNVIRNVTEIYNRYPSRCPIGNRSTGKSSKNKEKLKCKSPIA